MIQLSCDYNYCKIQLTSKLMEMIQYGNRIREITKERFHQGKLEELV